MKRLAPLAAILFLLASCALAPAHSPESDARWQARRGALQGVEHFVLHGRFSAGGLGAVGGHLFWEERPDGFELRVSGPFGSHPATVTGHGETVEVRSEQESFTTTDPEAALRQRLGWDFPVRHLRWWILGVPAPGPAADVSLDEDGLVTAMQQDGWTLDYEDYLPYDSLSLPHRVSAQKDDARIRLVIDQWSDVGGAAGNLPAR
ncbi:MAG TPA: lipoprotein insertase outer membrane protein LolB [Candidatus Binatia bacterium]|nr:lipoprotein insertase outer membrane protein LolB [Candidatus Binatia bacterium]